jgi:hypothetical protein
MTDVSRGLLFSSSSIQSSGPTPPVGPFVGDVLVSSASSPYLRVYPFTAASGWGAAYSAPASPPAVAVDSSTFVPDGSAVIVGQRSTPYISAYAWTSGSGFGAKYSDPATALPGTSTAAVTASTSVIFATSGNTPFINAYPWDASTGFGVKYSNPATLPQASLSDISVSPTSTAVCVTRANSTAPHQFQAYAFDVSTGFGALYSQPSVTGASYAVKWNFEGDIVFGFTSGGSYLYAWPWSDSTGFGTAYSAPTVSPTLVGRDECLDVGSDSTTVVVGKSSAPQFRVWAFDKVSGWGAELSSITIGGNAAALNIALTNDVAFFGCSSTSSLRAFDWSSSGVGSSRGDAGFSSAALPTNITSYHSGS